MNQTNIIILPGWGGSQETWQDFIEVAEKNFDSVHVIDLPCFGISPCPTEAWGVDEYVEFVKKEITKLNISGKKILLGHSFGGQVAVSLMAKYTNFTDILILSGAAIVRPKYSARKIFLGLIAKSGKIFFRLPIIEKFDVLAKKLLYGVVGSRDYVDSSGIKREIFKKIIYEDKRYLLPKIKVPTLILWGEFDVYVPVKYGKIIHKSITGSTMYIVKNGGHGLHIHNIKEIDSVINKFVSHV